MVKRTKNPKKGKIIDKLRNFKKDLMTIPNLLTSIRIVLVPVVLLFIWFNTPVMRLWSWIFYTIATVTDFFDGYLARKSGTVSVSGCKVLYSEIEHNLRYGRRCSYIC